MSGAVPPFSLTANRHDEDTFLGRLLHIIDVFDPRKLLLSDAEIDADLKLLDDFRNGSLAPGITNEQLWNARHTREALVHPDTGKKLPTLFSFAAYTPMQPPIIVGLCWPNASTATTLFWQWANQSYNVGVNYCNRNEAGALDDRTLAMSYAGAVGVSCSIALGMGRLSTRLQQPILKLLAPFAAVSAAGITSLVFMRHKELEVGVAVRDADGKERGSSVAAAREGIAKCCVPRIVWNVPNLLIPPFVMASLEPYLARNPRMRLPAIAALGTCLCFVGIYPAQAIFSQKATIESHRLEPQFQGLLDEQGEPVHMFYYNKGL